jgi:hypothetical protein
MRALLILFPCDAEEPSKVDDALAPEYEAARFIGFQTALYHHGALFAGDLEGALAPLDGVRFEGAAILRGWMVPGEIYQSFYECLKARGILLEVSPQAYEQSHYLPLAYPLIAGLTSRSEWFKGDDETRAWAIYERSFQADDAVIKDWVKSAKKAWREGCFIPAGTDRERFGKIYRTFRQVRGKLFNRGVVLREFMPIVERGSDIRGLPLVEETRLFFWHHHLLVKPSSGPLLEPKHQERWEEVARRFESDFMTIDVARLTDGSWKIVEVGDGGGSGLPVGLDPERFYGALWNQSVEA